MSTEKSRFMREYEEMVLLNGGAIRQGSCCGDCPCPYCGCDGIHTGGDA